jgi:chlorite dismutase
MALDITIRKSTGVDISEKGRSQDGQIISLDRRLYMQLLAFGACRDVRPLIETLEAHRVEGALYANLNDPFGIALVTISPDPDYFVTTVRTMVHAEPLASLTPQPAFTLFGRTYAIGYENDLEEVLLERPRRYVCNSAWPWAIWYPLRRTGAFEQLGADEQRTILMEHGGIGRAYGRADHAHDVRLACYGFDPRDNDLVIGLLGKDLYPLSALVQRMRQTKQTSQYLSQIGPFFVGKALWQSKIA